MIQSRMRYMFHQTSIQEYNSHVEIVALLQSRFESFYIIRPVCSYQIIFLISENPFIRVISGKVLPCRLRALSPLI